MVTNIVTKKKYYLFLDLNWFDMKNEGSKGFSLIELLLVVTIIGVIAALAVPALQKGILAAENGSTFSTMRTISSSQVDFYSRFGRFARLAEINSTGQSVFGTTIDNRVVRGQYTFEMTPATPTDAELRSSFTMTATRTDLDGVVYKYELTQTGEIIQILP